MFNVTGETREVRRWRWIAYADVAAWIVFGIVSLGAIARGIARLP